MRSRGRKNGRGNREREAREQERAITTEGKEVILLSPPHPNASLITLQFSPELCNNQHKVRITIKKRKRNWNGLVWEVPIFRHMISAYFSKMSTHDIKKLTAKYRNWYLPWVRRHKAIQESARCVHYPEPSPAVPGLLSFPLRVVITRTISPLKFKFLTQIKNVKLKLWEGTSWNKMCASNTQQLMRLCENRRPLHPPWAPA